jgi:serine/threonine protein kinase
MLRSDVNADLPRFPGWETLEFLGEGGMCAVYRGRPAGGGDERALKVLTDRSEHAVERFAREARLLERLDHPNVVQVHELHDEARPPWLVMDLLTGRDLEERMHAEGPMDPERAARLFAGLANGLAAVHAAGVRHRDIKPANIMLGDDGIPRLIDFGIARDTARAHVTKKGFVVGTASYLPPEIFTEDDSRGVQDSTTADVYALGQTLSEVLAGSPIHRRDSVGTQESLLVRIMRDKLEREHLDPREGGAPVPDGLADVVKYATAREPAQRYTSASELEAALRRWLRTRSANEEAAPITWVDPASLPPTLPAPTPPPPPPTQPPAIARTAAVGAAGAIGVFGMGAIAVALALVAVVGLGALWALRPSSPVDEVAAVIREHARDFASCPGSSRRGEVVVDVAVRSGKATSVEVARSSMDTRTDRCVVKVLERSRYPSRRQPYSVQVPVTFR